MLVLLMLLLLLLMLMLLLLLLLLLCPRPPLWCCGLWLLLNFMDVRCMPRFY